MYNRIKELRIEHNLTQEDINTLKLIKFLTLPQDSTILEISRELYSLYESLKRPIPLKILIKLAKVYNTSIDYIIGDTDERKPHN